MRYISDDGKVFNTEQDCLEHENSVKKRIEEERIKKEQTEIERKELLKVLKEVNNLYSTLEEKVCEYEKKYGSHQKVYFAPFNDILDMLYK